MKQLLIAAVFTAFAVTAKSQVYVQGGLNLANISSSNSGETNDNNTLATFNAGVLSRFGLSKVIDLESGLLLTGHGAKAERTFNNGQDYVRAKFNPLYLQVPLNLVVKFPIDQNNTGIFLNAGPYIAMGVAGKSKYETRVAGVSTSSSSNIKFSNDDPLTSEQDDAAFDKLKRFDYGVNVGGGVEFKHLLLKVNYGFGLAKINSTQTDNSVNDKNKYRTLSFSVGIPLSR